MNKINLEMDLDGKWLYHMAGVTNLIAQTKKPVRSGCFHFPAAFGKGFAEACRIEPGLSISLLHLHTRHPLTIQYGGQADNDLYYCRYDLAAISKNIASFTGHRAWHPIVQTIDKGSGLFDLTLVMTRQWITDNLHMLADTDGRMMEAYNAGLAYCSYQDIHEVTHTVRQHLTALPNIVSSLRHVFFKGIILELISLSWSNVILQRRPNTYVNKIA